MDNMYCMFNGCSLLEKLNLSNFDTSNVNTMACMFFECKSLKELNFPNYKGNATTNRDSMFDGCIVLEKNKNWKWKIKKYKCIIF